MELATAHHLSAEEATEWFVPPGAYHEGCCPECNGAAAMLPPFGAFDAAASTVVAHLRARLGFALCMVTRLELGRMRVVAVEDDRYGLRPGTALHWTDSICSRMTAGGPRVAPDVRRISAYAAAPLVRELGVGAYAGAPLEALDGSLLGTLAAFHPEPVPAAVAGESGLLELQARLLSTLLCGWGRASRRGAAGATPAGRGDGRDDGPRSRV
ncbi:MAG: GAF domain-containing protein, partial [Actinomycetota bacterium]|nr:GAF domain-containing protein [Actinomycetota bacterium]